MRSNYDFLTARIAKITKRRLGIAGVFSAGNLDWFYAVVKHRNGMVGGWVVAPLQGLAHVGRLPGVALRGAWPQANIFDPFRVSMFGEPPASRLAAGWGGVMPFANGISQCTMPL